MRRSRGRGPKDRSPNAPGAKVACADAQKMWPRSLRIKIRKKEPEVERRTRKLWTCNKVTDHFSTTCPERKKDTEQLSKRKELFMADLFFPEI